MSSTKPTSSKTQTEGATPSGSAPTNSTNGEKAKSQEVEKCRLWLNNLVGTLKLGVLTYEETDQLLPGNKHIWTVKVQLKGTTIGQGKASIKKEAKEKAAKGGLETLAAKYGKAAEEVLEAFQDEEAAKEGLDSLTT